MRVFFYAVFLEGIRRFRVLFDVRKLGNAVVSFALLVLIFLVNHFHSCSLLPEARQGGRRALGKLSCFSKIDELCFRPGKKFVGFRKAVELASSENGLLERFLLQEMR